MAAAKQAWRRWQYRRHVNINDEEIFGVMAAAAQA